MLFRSIARAISSFVENPITNLVKGSVLVLIGVSEAVAGFVLQPSLKSLFSYGLLIVILLLRPQGLLGKAT